MSQFTPGPWKIDGREITARSGASIVVGDRGLAGDNTTADAKLISASPDLLALVQQALDRFTDNDFQPANHALKTWIESATAAIARATGTDHA